MHYLIVTNYYSWGTRQLSKALMRSITCIGFFLYVYNANRKQIFIKNLSIKKVFPTERLLRKEELKNPNNCCIGIAIALCI